MNICVCVCWLHYFYKEYMALRRRGTRKKATAIHPYGAHIASMIRGCVTVCGLFYQCRPWGRASGKAAAGPPTAKGPPDIKQQMVLQRRHHLGWVSSARRLFFLPQKLPTAAANMLSGICSPADRSRLIRWLCHNWLPLESYQLHIAIVS